MAGVGPIPASKQQEKILVVDDTAKMRLLVEGCLRGFGYTCVSTAPSAAKAFKWLAEAPGSTVEEKIDLILMDVEMPGMDGIEACRRIKSELGFTDLPIIMVTAVVGTDFLVRAFDAGAMDYVNKPLNKPELRARVSSALALKRAIDSQKRSNAELDGANRELREALDNVKRLTGLLPICASCKKIRNDEGYWSGIEAYISEHSEADFSHAVCPECIKQIYPNISQRVIDEISGL